MVDLSRRSDLPADHKPCGIAIRAIMRMKVRVPLCGQGYDVGNYRFMFTNSSALGPGMASDEGGM